MGVSAILEALRVRLAVDASRWLIGAEHVAKHGAPPRYVWVPMSDRYGPPEKIGGNPRVLATRIHTLDLHLWGASYDNTESLLDAALAGLILECTNTSLELLGSVWDPQRVVDRGTLVVQTLAIKLPIRATAAATATITAVAPDNDDTVQGDGALDWGEET